MDRDGDDLVGGFRLYCGGGNDCCLDSARTTGGFVGDTMVLWIGCDQFFRGGRFVRSLSTPALTGANTSVQPPHPGFHLTPGQMVSRPDRGSVRASNARRQTTADRADCANPSLVLDPYQSVRRRRIRGSTPAAAQCPQLALNLSADQFHKPFHG